MLNEINVRELAEIDAPERAFLSLYLSGPDAMESMEKQIKSVRALLKDNKDEVEYFDENMKLVEKHLKKNPFESGGMCIFACWALDYFKAFQLAEKVSDWLVVDSSPYIRPLAELQDEYENFAVVVADNTSARVYLVVGAKSESEEKIKGDIKNHVRKGGWSQQRYERRRDKQLLLYSKEIAEKLMELRRREPFERILMVGSRETLNEIKRALPESLSRILVGDKALDLSRGDKFVDKEIFDLYFEEERRSEQKLWEQIKNEYLRGGRAVVGAKAVLDAAKAGRVSRAIVTRDARIDGHRCPDCEYLGEGAVITCPACGSVKTFEVDLVNEIVELLTRTGAEADFVDAIPGLTEAGDIAALLRY